MLARLAQRLPRGTGGKVNVSWPGPHIQGCHAWDLIYLSMLNSAHHVAQQPTRRVRGARPRSESRQWGGRYDCTRGKVMLSICTFGNVMVDRRQERRNARHGRSMTCEAAGGKIML
jgi:hypothetical protein